ncbi:MAG: hypothetical protein ACOH5I_23055 [Oligoflexus sp.]
MSQPFDVLRFRSPGFQAVEFEKKTELQLDAYGILVDGEIHSQSTESITYDRTLVTVLDLHAAFPVSSQLFLRPSVSVNPNMQKIEGKTAPRSITEKTWLEFEAAFEMTFLAQNSLELFLGIHHKTIPAHHSETETSDIKMKDEIASGAINYPVLGVVKRSGAFEGGFYFISGQDKARTVTKKNDFDGSEFRFDDHIYQPTSIAVFARGGLAGVKAYGEFTAVQAGDGGNKTDDGYSVEEDYIRFLFAGTYPLRFGSGIDLVGGLNYKSLSYADNRNVTIQTMPMLGMNLGLRLKQELFPIEVSVIYVNGRDGQSIDEFNASYRVQGLGLRANIGLVF